MEQQQEPKKVGMGGMIAMIVVVLLVVGGCSVVSLNNQLVTVDEQVNAAWGEVESSLQRRFDLIPNLVNTVKGYAQHESGIFEEVARLRSQWGEARNTEQKVEASSGMERALGRLMVVAEKYPDLKANQNFIALQDELSGTENRIKVARDRYNEAVRNYNVTIGQFPASMLARFRNFKRRDTYFQSAPAAKEAPKVQF